MSEREYYTMSVTLRLPPHVEARIQADAANLSLPVEDYLVQLVMKAVEQQSATGSTNQVPADIVHLTPTIAGDNHEHFLTREEAIALVPRIQSQSPMRVENLLSYISVPCDQAIAIDECCENHD